MTKNKSYKTRRNKRNRKFGKRRRRTFKTYTFKIRTAIVNYATPGYTERNLNFEIYPLLQATSTFQQLKPQYQQYKLEKVTFIGMPRVVQGTDPAPVWIYLDTYGHDSFNYVGIQELQGSRRLPVKRTSYNVFSATGRQDDFHYWYDVDEAYPGGISIRLHSEAIPDEHKHWQFQIEFSVHFRGFVVKYEENSKNKCRTIREISGSSGDEEQEEENLNQDPGEEEIKTINSINI